MKLFRLSSLLYGVMLLLCTACSKDEPTPLTLDALAIEGAPATNTLRSLEEAQAEALQIFFCSTAYASLCSVASHPQCSTPAHGCSAFGRTAL